MVDPPPPTDSRPADTDPSSPGLPADSNAVVLCPYCGRTQRGGDRCGTCGGLWEPLSRMATQIAMGPWFIRDKNKPFQPGCSYETLKRMAERGKLKPVTVLRGPTTHQFWAVARNVPGVSHLVGFCHHCGSAAPIGADRCDECHTRFEEPRERDRVGLRYPSEEAVRLAERELQQRLRARARVDARLAEEAHDDHGFTDDFIEESLNDARLRLASAEGADQSHHGTVYEEPVPREVVAAEAAAVTRPATPQEIEDPRATPKPESRPAAPREDPQRPVQPSGGARSAADQARYRETGDWALRGGNRLLLVMLILLIAIGLAILGVLAYVTWFADGVIEVFGVHIGTGGVQRTP